MGTLSPCPWDLSLSRQNGWLLGRLAPPRHSGPWVGAPVASLRSRTFRPGEVSINRVPGEPFSDQNSLARTTAGAVQQLHVLGAVRWPVLK